MQVATLLEATETSRVRRLLLEKFPVTILLGLQYGALVALPAVLHRTHPESLILAICGIGVFVALFVEAVLAPIRKARDERAWRLGVTWRSALWVMIIGWLASWVGVLLGQGTYATQTGTHSESHLAAFVTPFYFWPLFGVAMVLWLRRRGEVTDRRAWVVLGVNMALQLGLVVDKAILAPLMSFVLAVAFMALITGMVRIRYVVVAIILIPLAWPFLYNSRNTRRIVEGANPYAVTLHSAGNRLRLDLEMAQIAQITHIPANIEQPTPLTLVRTGLLPRFLDSGRGSLNTVSGLSVALGEPADSSDTATTLGLAYIEQEWLGVIGFVAALTLIVAVVIRRRDAWSLAFLGILVQQAIWIESTYPDLVAAVLQSIVSLAVAVGFAYLFQIRRDRSPATVG